MLSAMVSDDSCSEEMQPGVIGLGGWETCARLSKQEQRKDKQTMEVRGKQGKKYELRQSSLMLTDSWGDLGWSVLPDDRFWKILNEAT